MSSRSAHQEVLTNREKEIERERKRETSNHDNYTNLSGVVKQLAEIKKMINRSLNSARLQSSLH